MHQRTAIVVASYGAGQPSALSTLTAIGADVGAAFPHLPLTHAFTSSFLRDALARRGGAAPPLVSQALAQLAHQGVTQVLLQPTHLLPGGEFEAMVEQLEPYRARMRFALGAPLLHTPGDVEDAAAALPACLPPLGPGEGGVFLGHGTDHAAHALYAQLEQALHRQGQPHLYVGTLREEGLARRLPTHLTRLYVHPLTVVCGTHARRDMLSGGESWCRKLTQAGFSVTGIPRGLGDCPAIRALYVRHARQAADALHL